MTRPRLRALAGAAGAVVVLVPLGWFWQQSLVPDTYSVMDMGFIDTGGGPAMTPMSAGGTSVTDLVADPDRRANVRVDLVARQDGRRYTLNGKTPGPQITATVGQLVEVHLRNASVDDGVSLHWHGVDVPNAEDGVAGVTQDAVEVGKGFTYRFVVDQPGTYWYHSHQVSHDQVVGGLLGPLVVLPRGGIEQDQDVTAVAHTYRGVRTLNGRKGDLRVKASPGQTVRVRVINTDNATVPAWSSEPYRVLAIDGSELHEPTDVTRRKTLVPAGGRADLEITVPASGARVQVATTAIAVGPELPRPPEPRKELDLLTYGTPSPVPFDVDHPDRTFDYSIGRRPGFLDGKPGLWWSINGHLFPDVPMFMVSEGDVVKFHIENHSGEVHPMHLHGHHAVLVSRDGKTARGSPLWVDSVDVADGETVDLVFLADNPGVWMDHCHNLPHAVDGLVAHLMYEGVTTPFRVGGDADNTPE